MMFNINFDKDGTSYYGIVEVRGDKMRCIDFCKWKYLPSGAPYSVDEDWKHHREDVENLTIARLLVEDLDVDSTDDFEWCEADGVAASCYLGNMCYEMESEVRPQFGTLEEDGICCNLYTYTKKGTCFTATKIDPTRKRDIEQAFKKYLCEMYAMMRMNEEVRALELAEEYERDYHSDYCPEEAHERIAM